MLAARVVADDHAIECGGAIGSALTAFAHHHALGTWSLAGAVAAHGVLPSARTFLVCCADYARVELDELARPVCPAAAPKAWCPYRAIGVEVARHDTALTFTTFMTWEAIDNRRDADPVDAHVGDAGIIMLIPTVSVVFTRHDATALGAKLALRAATRTDLLSSDVRPESGMNKGRNRRQRDAEKLSTVASTGESPGHNIERVLFLYHRQLSTAI